MVQKTTSKTVFGPTIEEASGMVAPTEMTVAQNAAPSFYDSPFKLPVGDFRVGDSKMYGVERMPIGGGSALSVGATPVRGGGAGIRFNTTFKKGGNVKKAAPKKMAKGGKVSSASKRGDGCATKGKTKGRFV